VTLTKFIETKNVCKRLTMLRKTTQHTNIKTST